MVVKRRTKKTVQKGPSRLVFRSDCRGVGVGILYQKMQHTVFPITMVLCGIVAYVSLAYIK